jgi:hypothetical protein
MEWFVAIVIFCSSIDGNGWGRISSKRAADCISLVRDCVRSKADTMLDGGAHTECFKKEADGKLWRARHAKINPPKERKIQCRKERVYGTKFKVCE